MFKNLQSFVSSTYQRKRCRNPARIPLEECAGIMFCKYLMASKDFSKGSILGLQINEPFSRLCVALIGRDKVRKMREKFTASVRERSMIVLMY